MLFGNKKNNVIDRRIKDLQKEMKRVQGEMKTAARPGAAQPAMSAPRVPVASGPVFGAKQTLGKTDNDLFAHAVRQSEAGGATATGRPFAGDSDYPSLFDRPDTNPQTVRKKFANYFMAGHFQNLRPLRQESRIVRNKAIVMVILVLAVGLLVGDLKTH